MTCAREHPRHRCRAQGRADAALAAAVDLGPRRAASRRSTPPTSATTSATSVEGERVVTHLFACTRSGYVGWRWSVTVARATRQQGGHGRRGRADPRRRGDRRPGLGALPRADPARRPVARRPAAGRATTTRGWSRRTPSATTRSTPTTRRRSAQVAQDLGLGRVRTLSVEGRELAAQRWYDGDGGPDSPLAQSGAAPLPQLRLPGPHRRPAHRDLRRLRQRRRQRRRPGGQHRPRLRCPLRGAAGQEARAASRCPDPVFDTLNIDEVESF